MRVNLCANAYTYMHASPENRLCLLRAEGPPRCRPGSPGRQRRGSAEAERPGALGGGEIDSVGAGGRGGGLFMVFEKLGWFLDLIREAPPKRGSEM